MQAGTGLKKKEKKNLQYTYAPKKNQKYYLV